jgi:uncharacterized protein
VPDRLGQSAGHGSNSAATGYWSKSSGRAASSPGFFSSPTALVARYDERYGRHMQCDECWNPATLQLTQFRNRALRAEQYFCDGCAQAHQIWDQVPNPQYPASVPSLYAEVEVDVETIIISHVHEQQVIVLRESHGRRTFSILTGIFEATSLDQRLKGPGANRPLTFDAWVATAKVLGARVEAVCIRALEAGVFFADVRLVGRDGRVVVDTRPSDAFSVAVTAGCPILVNERLLAAVHNAPP